MPVFRSGGGAVGMEVGNGNGDRQLFCSWRSLLKIPASLAQVLKSVNKSPFCIPQAYFEPLLCYISEGLLVVWSLQRQGLSFQSHSGSLRAELLIFKVPSIESH